MVIENGLNKGLNKLLIKNSIKCLECNEVLVSTYRHHFSMCNCPNKAFTDGGNSYQRWGASDLSKIEDKSNYLYLTDEEYEDLKEKQRRIIHLSKLK